MAEQPTKAEKTLSTPPKAVSTAKQEVDVIGLASELFVRHYSPNLGRTAKYVAEECFKAARAFAEVAADK